MSIKKEELTKFAKELSLEIFKVGCDKVNFSILKMAMAKPITINDIKKEINRSSMPLNRRVNLLVKVGLLKREHKKTKIIPTKITKIFIKIIKNIQDIIEKEVEVKTNIMFK